MAVSGGADSVALLRLMSRRNQIAADIELVVVHVDHEMRGQTARQDASFVRDLAEKLGLPFFSRTRSQLSSPERPVDAAGLRDLRLSAYRAAQDAHGLCGVLLAHHADDVAETLLIRILRGSPRSGTLGLAPLRNRQVVSGATLLRPLLDVHRRRLRGFLKRIGQPWREDATNAMDISLRNRLRRLLAGREAVIDALLALARSAGATEAALDRLTPQVELSPRIVDLASLPEPIRRRAARRWLVERGAPDPSAGPKAVDTVLALLDTAGPRAASLAGGVRIHRHRGRLVAEGGND